MDLSSDRFLLCSCLVLSMTNFGVLFHLNVHLSFEFSVSRGNSVYAVLGIRMVKQQIFRLVSSLQVENRNCERTTMNSIF